LPEVPDIEAAARYIPASSDLVVGGDWYDIIVMQDGRLGIAIGDVAGHGVAAAAAMGQVRSAFRAYLLEGLAPGSTIERLNGLLRELLPGSMATLVCGWLDPETGRVTIARAGHPPPLLVRPDRRIELIEGGLAPPLGVVAGIAVEDATLELPVGATLFFYTDGLVERRRESLDRGLLRLESSLADVSADLEESCDRVIERVLGDGRIVDDAVLLAIRRVSLSGKPVRLSLPAQPERLSGIRRVLGRWLRQNGAIDQDVSDVLVAATEACANVIQHAYETADGVMEIGGEIDHGELTLSVRDFGSWMSPAPSEGDRGLMLMRGLMDSVEVTSSPEGTLVSMRRRLGETRDG
jgi:anti-sigma regulatory factor (Ser/Thr protein kinase)